MGCKCNWKKWLVGSLVVAIAYWAMDYVVHEVVLKGVYAQYAHLWRTPAEIPGKLPVAYVGYVVFGLLFVCIYRFGHEAAKPKFGQGLRFGILMGLLVWGARLLLDYPFFPAPDKLYFSWFAWGLAEYAVLGAFAAFLYKEKQS